MEYVVQQGFNALSIGGEYALLALGLAIVVSVMGLAKFAHGEFITLSGYTMYALFIFATPTSAWSLLPIGILASITAAVVFERSAFRPIRNAPATTGLLTALGHNVCSDKFSVSDKCQAVICVGSATWISKSAASRLWVNSWPGSASVTSRSTASRGQTWTSTLRSNFELSAATIRCWAWAMAARENSASQR